MPTNTGASAAGNVLGRDAMIQALVFEIDAVWVIDKKSILVTVELGFIRTRIGADKNRILPDFS